MTRTAALLLHPPFGTSRGERLVDGARRAAALDLLSLLREAGMRDVLVLCDPSFSRQAEEAGAHVLPSAEGAFHFGLALKRVVREEGLDGILYVGSGSGVLLDLPQVRRLVDFARRGEAGALLNNAFSCDVAAIAQARRLLDADLPAIDNSLGFTLSDLDMPVYALPRDAASQFDIDTPTDLVLLRAAGRGGPRLRAFLAGELLFHPFLDPLLGYLADRRARLLLVGRVNPETWGAFEREVACRTSALAEGRGLRSYPDRPGTVLGTLLEEVGPERMFRELSLRADAAILDTRPLLARGGRLPPASDRFASDLLSPEEIRDPIWAAFTRAALSSPVPVLLGGHSLVSGGLFLLAEACWKGHDLPRRLHPQTFGWTKESS